MIRPINRRDGKQSFVRIDASHAGENRPNFRAQQLEDYVAQIRNHAAEVEAAQPMEQDTAAKIIADVSAQQQSSNLQLTSTEQLEALRVVTQIDAGYQWIADSNRNAALESLIIGNKIADLPTPQPENQTADSSETPQTENALPSSQLVQDIAAAIAAVLTNSSENQLQQKVQPTAATEPIQNSESESPATFEFVKEPLRLQPELPRANYSLPVSDHDFADHDFADHDFPIRDSKRSYPIETETTNTVSLTAAAWDVEALRWPEVTDRILADESMLTTLAENCLNMLSPYGKTIAVTAPDRHKGTTTLAITLARLISQMGKRVLLVDADISRPSLSANVGIAGINWFSNANSTQAVGESIVHEIESGICVMAQTLPIAPSQAYATPIYDVLEKRLDQVRSEFDFIVIDAGPAAQIVDEMSSNSHLIDAAMLVNQDVHCPAFVSTRESLIQSGVFKFIAAQNAIAPRRVA